MKLNNKGFAITTILYGILILFLLLSDIILFPQFGQYVFIKTQPFYIDYITERIKLK